MIFFKCTQYLEQGTYYATVKIFIYHGFWSLYLSFSFTTGRLYTETGNSSADTITQVYINILDIGAQ